MKKLTDDKFKFGSIAMDILNKSWTSGKLMTYNKFAKVWLTKVNQQEIKPEWKYLTDLSDGNMNMNHTNWKKQRNKISKTILREFNQFIKTQQK